MAGPSRPDTGVELHRLGAALVPPVKLSRFTGDASSLVCREFQSQKSFPSGVCSVSSGRLLCPSVPQVPSRKAGKRPAWDFCGSTCGCICGWKEVLSRGTALDPGSTPGLHCLTRLSL